MTKLIGPVVAIAMCLLIGALAVQAQLRDLDDPGRSWNERVVIGLPDDDESDDEGDDEGGDCPPYPAPVAWTGQTSDQHGVSVDPRFTDNLDGTVTDNLTGLIWLQNADCFGPIDQDLNSALANAYFLADGACGLTDGSVIGDWRLPNVKELLSLVDYRGSSPTLPFGHPFVGGPWENWPPDAPPPEIPWAYWSSSSTQFGPFDNAYVVDFTSGWVWTDLGSTVWWSSWPVRGGQ